MEPNEYGSLREIRKEITIFFKHRLAELLRNQAQPYGIGLNQADAIYLDCFEKKMTLERFGLLSQDVIDLFNEMTIVKIGIGVEKIRELSDVLARNNDTQAHGQVPDRELTDDEYDMVKHYHQFLFCVHKKNPEPFNHNL